MTKEECKNQVANSNNFDSFERAIRYTFNRELLQSEEEFINKLIDESMDTHARNCMIELLTEHMPDNFRHSNGVYIVDKFLQSKELQK